MDANIIRVSIYTMLKPPEIKLKMKNKILVMSNFPCQ